MTDTMVGSAVFNGCRTVRSTYSRQTSYSHTASLVCFGLLRWLFVLQGHHEAQLLKP